MKPREVLGETGCEHLEDKQLCSLDIQIQFQRTALYVHGRPISYYTMVSVIITS